jgi:uncharacterized protein
VDRHDRDWPDSEQAAQKPSAWPATWARFGFFALGWVFFGLGFAGALLPGLPTTVFMILALWAFSRSSQRFHDWLYHHRIFGPSLQRWHRDRVIPRGVKAIAFSAMAVSMYCMVALAQLSWWIVFATALVMAVGVVYIARCPSQVALPATAPEAVPEPASRSTGN